MIREGMQKDNGKKAKKRRKRKTSRGKVMLTFMFEWSYITDAGDGAGQLL